MNKTILVSVFSLLPLSHITAEQCFEQRRNYYSQQHQEVFVGTGSSVESSKQDAYKSIYSQGKPINSFVSSETKRTGANNYITVFKIKTQ